MKRYFCTILFPIVVASAGCTTTDNHVGSLGKDSGVADGSGQVARDVRAQPADAGLVLADAVAPDAAGAAKDVAQDSPPAGDVPDAAVVGKDAAPESPLADAAAPDVASVGKDAVPESISSDAAVPDAVDAAKDVAPGAPDVGTTHQCQLNADGTCSAVTPNTACARFIGRRYDESAGCYSTVDTTLGCCATTSGEVCGLPAASGCYQIALDGGTVVYWTPALTTPAVTIPGGQPCDETRNLKVPGAHSCGAVSLDAAVLPDASATDAHVPVILPLCTTDRDCCISIDDCMATATMTGNGSYGPVPGTHATPGTCLGCIPPAIQVQCQGGFCVGTRLTNIYDSSSPLLRSHCGSVALPDAGAAPAVSPHAIVDGGVSYQTFWSCGGP